MSMTTIVTGYHPAGYEQYGRACLKSLQAYWSEDIIVYAEDFIPETIRQIQVYPPPQTVIDFQKRHGPDPMMQGKVPAPGTRLWKKKDKTRGYNFRFDVVKFSKMAMYAQDAAHRIAEGIMVWLDGDVLTHSPVPDEFVLDMLGDYDCAYLGREPYHSETGFLVFRLPEARALIDQWANFYNDRTFIKEREWHSAYLFDQARLVKVRNIRYKNLTPGGSKHVWFQSRLKDYTDHLKGRRKELGQSPERSRG